MPDRTHLTPPELARRWGVAPSKVLAWIRSGELRALDLAARRGGRPRWRIPLDAILAFESGRSATPPPRRERRRPKTSTKVIKFF